MIDSLAKKKLEIEKKGLQKISDFLDLDVASLEELDDKVIGQLYNMAKLGMQFEKEINVSKRNMENHYVKVAQLVSETKNEIKKYIKTHLPQYA